MKQTMQTVEVEAEDYSICRNTETWKLRLEHAQQYARQHVLARVINIEVVKHTAGYKHYRLAIKLEDCNKFSGRQDKVILHEVKAYDDRAEKVVEATIDKYLGTNDMLAVVSLILLENSWL